MGLTAFVLTYLGFGALGVSMRRHHREVFGRPAAASAAFVYRAGGWILLAAGLAACVATWPGSVAVVAWFGLLTVGAFANVLVLTFVPRRFPQIAVAAPLVCTAAGLGAAL